VCAEALASGAPVVALAAGGVFDIIRDGEEGVLVDVPEPRAFAEGVLRAERTRFQPKALRDSARRFDVSRFRERVRTIVETVKPPRRIIIYIPNIEELAWMGTWAKSDANVATVKVELMCLALAVFSLAVLFDFRRAHLTPAFNPIGTLVHTGQGRDVATVIVDGRVVVDNGRATLVDEERIRFDGAAAANTLWTRVTGHSPADSARWQAAS